MMLRTSAAATALAAVTLTGVGVGTATAATPATTSSATVSSYASAIGGTVSRTEVMSRGQNWVNRRIPYSQTRYATDPDGAHRYRQDCSGYVSMMWHLRTSYTTYTLNQVSTPISWASLRKGDAILRASSHVVMFAGWIDAAHTRMYVYEEAHTGTTARHISYYKSYFTGNGYHPIRYNRISG